MCCMYCTVVGSWQEVYTAIDPAQAGLLPFTGIVRELVHSCVCPVCVCAFPTGHSNKRKDLLRAKVQPYSLCQ